MYILHQCFFRPYQIFPISYFPSSLLIIHWMFLPPKNNSSEKKRIEYCSNYLGNYFIQAINQNCFKVLDLFQWKL